MAKVVRNQNSQETSKGAPNVIRGEREILDSFKDKTGQGRRAQHRIGLISILGSYEYVPLFHTLFSDLGYSIMVPNLSRLDFFADEVAENIPSNATCKPAKSAHLRALEMIDRGATAIFMPFFQNEYQCAVLCSYSQAIGSSTEELRSGEVTLLDPCFTNVRISDFYNDPEAFDGVLHKLTTMDPKCAPSANEFKRALDHALAVQQDFDQQSMQLQRRASEWLYSDPNRRAVILVARTYNFAYDQTFGIDEKIAEMGFAVLSSHSIKVSLRDQQWSDFNASTMDHSAVAKWIARTTIDEPNIHAIFIHPAGCTYDVITIAECLKIAADANRRFGEIDLNTTTPDNVHDALISLVEAFNAEGTRQAVGATEDALSPSQVIDLLVDGYNAENYRKAADRTLAALPEKLCNTMTVLFNNSLEAFKANPDLNEIRLPALCKGCLVESLPQLLSMDLKRDVSIFWDEKWNLANDDPHSVSLFDQVASSVYSSAFTTDDEYDAAASTSALQEDQAQYRPKVGLVGNALLCLNPAIGNPIARMIEAQGGTPLLPIAANFHSEALGHLQQLENYAHDNVDAVLYLRDNNCVKSFTEGRESVEYLQNKYPNIFIVTVDLHRNLTHNEIKNRITLAVQGSIDRYHAHLETEETDD